MFRLKYRTLIQVAVSCLLLGLTCAAGAEGEMSGASAPPPSDPFNDAAYRKMLELNLPLSPDQIEKLRKLYDVTQQAAFATPAPPPIPVSSSMAVNLGPGQQPPVIRLASGFVTSLVFVDVTGSNWPIVSYGIGNPEAFNIQWDNDTNAIFIQAMKSYSHGNLAIRLKNLDTPVMISLVSGQKEVDYRVDMQVQQRGPNAVVPYMSMDYSLDRSDILVNFLDAIPPKDSTRLDVGTQYGMAWMHNGRMYFRTKLTLLSPAWGASVSSADGTRVYELAPTPMLLASDEGRTVSIHVEGL
ncbi:MAG: type IV secretion protein IcmK [Legionellales bacterium]|nr:type IV secretion protein IcmK [Legionellales bacterium]